MYMLQVIFLFVNFFSAFMHSANPRCNHDFFKTLQEKLQRCSIITNALLHESNIHECNSETCPHRLKKTAEWILNTHIDNQTSHQVLWYHYASAKALNTKYDQKRKICIIRFRQIRKIIEVIQNFCQSRIMLRKEETFQENQLKLQHLPTIAQRVLIWDYFDWLRQQEEIIKECTNQTFLTNLSIMAKLANHELCMSHDAILSQPELAEILKLKNLRPQAEECSRFLQFYNNLWLKQHKDRQSLKQEQKDIRKTMKEKESRHFTKIQKMLQKDIECASLERNVDSELDEAELRRNTLDPKEIRHNINDAIKDIPDVEEFLRNDLTKSEQCCYILLHRANQLRNELRLQKLKNLLF